MSEVTRVPLPPVKKGSLIWMWLGLLAAILLGVGMAWASVPDGVKLTEVQPGSGPLPSEGDVIFVNYVGKLPDGTVFDQSQQAPFAEGIFPKGNPFPLEEGATIPGFYEGLKQVQKGGSYILEIPGSKAYGNEPPEGSPIPPNADLVFDLEVVEFMSREDFQMRLQALQMRMQQQQQQGGGPGGAGGPGGPGGAAGPPQAPQGQ